MKSYKHLLSEAKTERTCVLAFARMSPPTAGHALVAQAVLREAKKHNAKHVIYLSATHDTKKNPLTVQQKVFWAKKSFPGVNIVGATDKVRTFIEAVKEQDGTCEHLIVVAGSDRVPEYKTLLDKYNGRDYEFKSITVVSAGERDPDADGATGMSATKLRAAAASNDFATFRKGVSSKLSDSDAKKMMDEVRAGLGIKRTVDETLEISKTRDAFYKGKQFLVGQIVKEGETKFEIIDRGSNYVTVVNEQGEVSKKFVNKLVVVDEVMDYTGSIYKGFVPSAEFCSVPNLIDTIELVVQEDVKDPFALIRAMQSLEEFVSGKSDNLDKAYESLENTGLLEQFSPILESMSERPTVKPGDKLRVAKIIADALGADSSSSNADQMVNSALRGIKTKPIGRSMMPIVQNMISLAREVGIKIDKAVLPAGITESEELEEVSKETLKSYTKKAMDDTLSGKKDRNKGMIKAYSRLAGTDKPLIKEDDTENPMTDPDVDSYGIEMDALGFEQLRRHLMKHKSLKHGNEPEPRADANKPGHSLDSKELLRKMKARKLKGY